jgi:hypothetical protein
MKKLKLLVFLVLLVAVVANGTPRHHYSTHALCDTSNDPSLCMGGVDTGCHEYCLGSANCSDWSIIHSACLAGGDPWVCKCTGTN